jgi:hypothetical protein
MKPETPVERFKKIRRNKFVKVYSVKVEKDNEKTIKK